MCEPHPTPSPHPFFTPLFLTRLFSTHTTNLPPSLMQESVADSKQTSRTRHIPDDGDEGRKGAPAWCPRARLGRSSAFEESSRAASRAGMAKRSAAAAERDQRERYLRAQQIFWPFVGATTATAGGSKSACSNCARLVCLLIAIYTHVTRQQGACGGGGRRGRAWCCCFTRPGHQAAPPRCPPLTPTAVCSTHTNPPKTTATTTRRVHHSSRTQRVCEKGGESSLLGFGVFDRKQPGCCHSSRPCLRL